MVICSQRIEQIICLPIIADGEAGFGGPLNVFELAKKIY